MGDRDDVAPAQRGQRVVDRLPALQPRCAGLGPLLLTDLLAQPGVLEHGRIVPAEFGRDLVEHLLSTFHPADQAHHRTIGLVLANDCSSSRCACSGPTRFNRLIVML